MEQISGNRRLLALDVLRGITIAGMILVNNPGSYSDIYTPLRHVDWNGLTPTDLVFPFFMFIMGISTYISLRKYDFYFSSATMIKILKRAVLIFLVGWAIDWFARFCFYWHTAPAELSFGENLWGAVGAVNDFRILGVLQRLALCYGATALIGLTMRHRHIPYLIVVLLVGYWSILLWSNGFAYDETNILSVVDCYVLTPYHMYYDHGIDPEGVLSTLPAIAHVLLGFYTGKLIMDCKWGNSRDEALNARLITLLLLGTVLTFAGFLLSYGCPINKKIWSPTFVLVTCGMASSLLALLIWVIDVKGIRRWSLFFESFGVNPLFMYVLAAMLSVLFGAIMLPWGESGLSIRAALYEYVFRPLMGNNGGSLLYALFFVALNWCIGYQLYKRRIYIKL